MKHPCTTSWATQDGCGCYCQACLSGAHQCVYKACRRASETRTCEWCWSVLEPESPILCERCVNATESALQSAREARIAMRRQTPFGST